MGENNYFTKEMEKTREIALEKDRLLNVLIESPGGLLFLKLISKANVNEVRVDGYVKEMHRSVYIEKPVSAIAVPYWQITRGGIEFFKSGGYTEEWSDLAFVEYAKLKAGDEKYQDQVNKENNKIQIEQKKVNISIWALIFSGLALVLSIYAAFLPDSHESKINSRLESIEQDLQKIKESDKMNRLDSLEGYKINTDTLVKK